MAQLSPSRLREGSETWRAPSEPSRSGVGMSGGGGSAPTPSSSRRREGDYLAHGIPRFAAYAAQVLHWTPDTFWSSTPEDLALAATDPTATAAPMTRADLETMMKDDAHG